MELIRNISETVGSLKVSAILGRRANAGIWATERRESPGRPGASDSSRKGWRVRRPAGKVEISG